MPERICKTAIEYPPGKLRQPGDRFDVEEQHIHILTKLEKIEPDAVPMPEKAPVEYIDADEPPQDSGEIVGTLHTKRPQQQSARRLK